MADLTRYPLKSVVGRNAHVLLERLDSWRDRPEQEYLADEALIQALHDIDRAASGIRDLLSVLEADPFLMQWQGRAEIAEAEAASFRSVLSEIADDDRYDHDAVCRVLARKALGRE